MPFESPKMRQIGEFNMAVGEADLDTAPFWQLI
jgi:hypothetical protein